MQHNHNDYKYELSIIEDGLEEPVVVRVVGYFPNKKISVKHARKKLLKPGQYFQIIKTNQDESEICKYWIIRK